MKTSKKYIFLFVIFLFVLVSPFIQVKALDNTYSITDTVVSQENDVSIEVKFFDYSNTSSVSFGLYGNIKNNINETKKIIISTVYYDKDYNEIVKTEKSIIMNAYEEKNYSDMHNLSIINDNYTVSDITYYTVSFNDDMVVTDEESNLIPSKMDKYSYLDYVIDSYDVNITVNEDNSYDIIETITAYFFKPKHGIIRSIPLYNEITRLDGTTSSTFADIYNVDINEKYNSERDNKFYYMKIGSSSYNITGDKKYRISYKYKLGLDNEPDYDELYFNIIGTEWDTVIGNVTFTITMPSDFEASKLGFSHGLKGSSSTSNIYYEVEDNIINGYYDGVLEAYEGLTVRCELPNGYFTNKPVDTSLIVYWVMGISGIGLLIVYLLWAKFGHDDALIETVEFYPPENFNSLDVAYVFNNKIKVEDITSLVVYLASKGYLKIEEGTNNFRASKDFTIIKLKNYDGNNEYEKMFLEGLFNCGSDGKTVTASEFYSNFYVTAKKILNNYEKDQPKLFENTKFFQRLSIFIFIILFIICFTFISLYGNEATMNTIIGEMIFGLFAMIPLLILFYWEFSIIIKVIILIPFSPLILLLLLEIIGPLIYKEYLFVLAGFFFLFSSIVILLCARYMPKRTKYGNMMYGKIKGFKNFIETAEKDRLEALVLKEPQYFYDILPFAYVLGISSVWISKFKNIYIPMPNWYTTETDFSRDSFNNFISNAIYSNAIASVCTDGGTYRYSYHSDSDSRGSSDSSGSSGGGSSGGGSGGGGGSSW